MLHADAHDLKTIFEKQRKHKVPLFQRRYVWDMEKQWEPLWEDVQAVAENYLSESNPQPHFLGAVVLKQDETASGEIETRLVIDGQQRLMTLQLFITAARDVCKSISNSAAKLIEEISQSIEKLGDQPDDETVKARDDCIRLRDAASKQHDNLEYLVANKMGVEKPDDIFKVWPTQADQKDFQCVMKAGSPEELRKLLPENDSRIREAYLYFCDKIDAWLKIGVIQNRPSRIDAMYKALRSGIIVVMIDLTKEDNAQVIFEALNARGTPLLESELVKNYLLYLCEEQRLSGEDLHKRYWQPFENDLFWQEEVKQGRLYRPRIEIFLQHYLTMQLGEEVSALELFDVFKDFVVQQPAIGPDTHLQLLHQYGDIFHKFYQLPTDNSEGLFFHRIDVMEMTTLFPLLLFVYNRIGRSQHDRDRHVLLLDLESFLVRRMICGMTTKQYNKLFLDLKLHLQGHPNDLAREARSYLLARTADSELWPDDKQFQQAWLTEPFYRRITRSRLRMVLEALEMASRTSKTEDLTLPKKALTIEHLMPQAWQKNWPLPHATSEAEDRREVDIHTIGNLTLVTKALNPSMKNAAWLTKRQAILENSVLKLNHYFQDKVQWDETQIAVRGTQLFGLASKIWPKPKE